MPQKQPDKSTHPNRRHGRVRCQDINCSLGVIQDLSASGMRVKVRGTRLDQGQSISVRVDAIDGPILLLCRVIWARRVGFFGREVGVAFEHLTDADRRQLALMGRSAAYNETILEDIERFRRAS